MDHDCAQQLTEPLIPGLRQLSKPSNHPAPETSGLQQLDWHHALEQISDELIAVLDVNGVYEFANPACHRFWGVADKQLLGCSLAQIVGKEIFSRQIKPRLQRCLSGEVVRFAEWCDYPGLSRRYMDVTHYPLRDQHSRIIGIVSTGRDATKQALAEQRLRDSEEQFRALFEQACWGIFVHDLDGRFINVNPYGCNQLGYSRDELLGMTVTDIDPEAATRDDKHHFWEQDGPQELFFEVNHRRKDGSVYPAAITLKPSTYAGQPAILALVQNLTERKQAEQALRRSEQRLKDAQRLGDLGDWDWDPATNTVTWSENLYHLMGLDPGQPLDYHSQLALFAREEAEQLHQAAKRILADGTSFKLEVRRMLPNGRERRLLVRGTADQVEDGRVVRVYGSILDITDLWALNETHDALMEAREQIDATSRAKADFLANMSHEIRTPLNGIEGMLQLLKESDLAPNLLECVDLALASSRSLQQVVDHILDFSKIEAGNLVMAQEPFSLSALVHAVVTSCSYQTVSKGVKIHSRLDPAINTGYIGDAAQLHQVLFNLVGNAVKYTDAGNIWVEINADKPLHDARVRLRFSVTDSGVGMPADIVEHMMIPFAKAESSARRSLQGPGLGLSIVRRLLNLMGGELNIDSTPGKGTRVWFEIALSPILAEH